MFILSFNNAISVFFLVVTERRGEEGWRGCALRNAICLFFSWLMRRAAVRAPQLQRFAKQMYALRFNQILAQCYLVWRFQFLFVFCFDLKLSLIMMSTWSNLSKNPHAASKWAGEKQKQIILLFARYVPNNPHVCKCLHGSFQNAALIPRT